jgi:hypothetical protein
MSFSIIRKRGNVNCRSLPNVFGGIFARPSLSFEIFKFNISNIGGDAKPSNFRQGMTNVKKLINK